MADKQDEKKVTPRSVDFAAWYNEIIARAELADHSPVRGCIVFRPDGFAIWEALRDELDRRIKKTGARNAYFPPFIPESYLHKEAAHVEGFSPELAVVTHGGGKELDEPVVVRPTSETIINAYFSKWIQSYRDLPVLINQWANVVRWELRPRLFLRTAEFLWQEGHTAHETEQEAIEEAVQMLEVYATFARNHLALPIYHGEKTESERFPGAVQTLCVEAMVQDRKAIQAGTSHFLGQNFARAAGIKYISRTGAEEHVWTTSWGASTRLIGTVIMTHADDDGMVLPPRIAPIHIVILPITPKEETRARVLEAAAKLAGELRALTYFGAPLDVEIDQRELGGGLKNWEWIKKGVPLRVELGPRDLESGNVAVSRRDHPVKAKEFVPASEFAGRAVALLDSIQQNLFERAKQFRDAHTRTIDTREEFYEFFTSKNPAKPEIHGGFVRAHWNGSREVEEQIKSDLKVTIRCIPFDDPAAPPEAGTCPFSGEPSPRRVVWAKAY